MDAQLTHYESKLAFATDAWDLKAALDAGENVVVIDARSHDAYNKEHIPGAINVPHRQMNPETTQAIDRSALVVTYCDGVGCNASTKGALKMVKRVQGEGVDRRTGMVETRRLRDRRSGGTLSRPGVRM